MKVLLVSPYPPLRDGLANYAMQMAAGLRADGDDVEVVSPQPSAAGSHEQFMTLRGLLRVARRARRADRVVVQFHPEIFFRGMRLDLFLRHYPGVFALFRWGGAVEVIAHETPYSDGGRAGAVRTPLWRLLWRQPAGVLVHTEAERAQMTSRLGVPAGRVRVLDHGERFQRRTGVSRGEARRRLGVDPDVHVFLAIGFLQPHKGFDRAARALSRLAGDGVRLDIVGEIRISTPEHDAYLHLLQDLASRDRRVHIHDAYVSDEEFDEWIVAADTVVLPYREIWSSGVAERAELYDRPVVVTDVGGLAEQVAAGGVVVHDAAQLVEAMAKLSGAEVLPETTDTEPGGTAAERVAPTVRRRAELLRQWHDPLDDAARPILPLGRPPDVRADPLALPPIPTEPGVKTFALRVVRKLTGWQLAPIVRYVNALRAVVLDEPGDERPSDG